VTRATGFPLVRIAAKVMLGKTLDELGVTERPLPRHVAAREREGTHHERDRSRS